MNSFFSIVLCIRMGECTIFFSLSLAFLFPLRAVDTINVCALSSYYFRTYWPWTNTSSLTHSHTHMHTVWDKTDKKPRQVHAMINQNEKNSWRFFVCHTFLMMCLPILKQWRAWREKEWTRNWTRHTALSLENRQNQISIQLSKYIFREYFFFTSLQPLC